MSDRPTIAALPPAPAPAPASPSTTPSSTAASSAAATNSPGGAPDPTKTVARLSSPWSTDDTYSRCTSCSVPFNQFNRRHHCRLCGRIFCHKCSSRRSLVPPSSIVLTPKGGKKVDSETRARMVEGVNVSGVQGGVVGFEREDDPDRMVTYMQSPDAAAADHADGAAGHSAAGGGDGTSPVDLNTPPDTLLYGRGLEERAKLAREPLRVCDACHSALASVQHELRTSNANAMRYNHIDPTDVRRLFNSPLAFTLGHEVRKAAYALNNLLPLPKRMGAFVTTSTDAHSLSGAYSVYGGGGPGEGNLDQCRDTCTALGGANLGNLDGVRIPARLLEAARGVAVMTVVKGGLGVGVEFGTGLVVARLGDDSLGGWSPPSAIGTAGISWGALVGAQISDHVFLLMDDNAVNLFSSNDGSFQLGADIGVSVGPLGRSAEADFGTTASSGSGGLAMAPIYTYSLSKGLYAGVSLDGKVIVTRERVNEKFYGHEVTARELLSGEVPTPPAAQPLYDALKRCHVYATSGSRPGPRAAAAASGGTGAFRTGAPGAGGELLDSRLTAQQQRAMMEFGVGQESEGNLAERFVQISPPVEMLPQQQQPQAVTGAGLVQRPQRPQRDFAMSPDRSGGGAC